MVAVPVHAGAVADTGAGAHGAIRVWLLFVILLVFAIVLVGGTTRLTESGLSITEWQPVTGIVPPLGEAAWQQAYDLYRQSPQYDLLNRGMSLAEYRSIFWWEWAHRQLGRFIGVVYLAGFVWFALSRAVGPRTLAALGGLGLLLGTQGVVGWIMVASGLQPGMTAVAPIKLTLHLTLACLFFAGTVAMFVRLGGAAPERATRTTRVAAWLLVVLAFGQIALGGFVAGHDAGLTYNTWPLIDGEFVPDGLTTLQPIWLNLADNVLAVQFNHRIGAYVLAAAIFAYAVATRREGAAVRGRALLLSMLVLAQIVVGIATLLAHVPIGLALVHQGMALILLFTLVWNASVFRSGKTA